MVEQRIRTRRDRFAAVLGARARARILLEASTESEWVARCLEELGHEVIVADPNFAAMYATRSRRVKTDRRDARTLAEACRLGASGVRSRVLRAARAPRPGSPGSCGLGRCVLALVDLIGTRPESRALLALSDPCSHRDPLATNLDVHSPSPMHAAL